MKKGDKSIRGGIQDFLCPFESMYITQGSNIGTHRGTMANDVRGAYAGVKYPYYAPCDCKLIWFDKSNGQGMWQSLEKVRFANGNIDYATFVTAHDETFDAQVGQVVRQGEQLGNMGSKAGGGAISTGVHCHIEIAQHKYDISNWKKNKYGIYCFPNETDTDDCYFVNDTNILNGMGGNWKMIPEEKHNIGYKAHVEKDGWQDWKFDGQTAGTTGQAKRMEALRIDYDKPIYAKAHIEKVGWVDYGRIDINTVIGTTGESKRLECICLKCDNIKYRVHIEGTGWTCWTKADGLATLGSIGMSQRIEAIEIVEI